MIAAIQNLRKLIKGNTLKAAVSMANSTLNKANYIILNWLFYCRMASIINLSEYSIFKELFQLFRFNLQLLYNLSQCHFWATSPYTCSIAKRKFTVNSVFLFKISF
jgi:hypothetical protein